MRLAACKFTAEANNSVLILFICWKYESAGSWGFDAEEWQQLILWKFPRKAQILFSIIWKQCRPNRTTKDLSWNITYRFSEYVYLLWSLLCYLTISPRKWEHVEKQNFWPKQHSQIWNLIWYHDENTSSVLFVCGLLFVSFSPLTQNSLKWCTCPYWNIFSWKDQFILFNQQLFVFIL